jgi:hypothetical protein
MPIAINGSGTITGISAGGLPDGVITTDDIAAAAVTQAKRSEQLTLATAQASTSGTSIDFTSIPSWVKKITVMFNGVSLSSTAGVLIQLGVSNTATTTGYAAGQTYVTTSGASAGGSTSTSGFPIQKGVATYTLNGSITFTLLNASSYIWAGSGVFYNQITTPYVSQVAGVVTLSGVANMVRVTSTSTDTFDAGSINIMYE